MKRFPKLIVALLLVAMVIGIFAAIPVSAAEYDALRLKSSMLTVGHYTNKNATGDVVVHCAADKSESATKKEIGCLVDNDNKSAYWSKPYKFNSLVDQGGSLVPVIMLDLSSFNEGAGVAIAGFDMRLRSALDCQPTHVVLQVTTSAGSNEWTTVADKRISIADWEANPKQRIEFTEVTAFKFRILAYDIADCNVSKDSYDYYTVCLGDETRFTLAEIDLLTIKEGDSTGSGNTGSGNTGSGNTGNGSTGATRPTGIQAPTRPAPTTATQAATQPATQATTTGGQSATKAPTQPATQAPTSGGQSATKAPTQPATQAPSGNVTEPTGSAPVEPTVDPSAPTETVDPSAPTEATEPVASVETTEPTVEVTEPEATVEATEPEATTPTTDTTGEETPDNITTIIIIAIAAAVVIAGAAIFFIIKKKKNG